MRQAFPPFWMSVQHLLLSVGVGGMLVLAYVAVPIIFQQLPDRIIAGKLAGEVLVYSNYLSLLCFSLLILFALQKDFQTNDIVNSDKIYLVLLLCVFGLIVINQFIVFPNMRELKDLVAPLDVMLSPKRAEFVWWHGVSSVLYLTHSLLGIGALFAAYPNSKQEA